MNQQTLHGLSNISKTENRLFFIGIGGISMSALAMIAHHLGYCVAGSDRTDSATCARLRAAGIDVAIGHDASHIMPGDVVIYNAAITQDNSEFARAEQMGLRRIYRTDFLAALMGDYPFAIGIAGMHGKSTASAMLSHILLHACKDPTVLIGAELPEIGGAFRVGHGDTFVFEACEYKDSFLSLRPTIGVVLNVEMDHPDYFKDMTQIITSFRRYLALPGPQGHIVVNADCIEAMQAAQDSPSQAVTFAIEHRAAFQAVQIRLEKGLPSFWILHDGEPFCEVELQVSGQHNVMNALACCAAAYLCGLQAQEIADGLSSFTGIRRRMEYKGCFPGTTAAVYDDFGHHPTEVLSTLRGARRMCRGRLYCVFQPHTYSRTKALFSAFTQAFAPADETLFVDIYAAREPFDPDVSAALLAAQTPHARYCKSEQELTQVLSAELQDDDMLVIMGAGDISRYAATVCTEGEKKV